MLNDYESALVDSKKSLEYDENYEISYEQIINACLHLGDLKTVQLTINQMKSINPNNVIIQSAADNCNTIKTMIKEAEIFSKLMNFQEAIEKLNQVLQISTACEHFISLRQTYINAKIGQSKVSSYF